MRSELEMVDEDWEFPLERSTEILLQPEAGKQSLFFRVACKRADYFADVGDIPQALDIEDVTTLHYSAMLHAIRAALAQPARLPIEEQPTRLIPSADRSTLPLVAPSWIEFSKTTPLLLVKGAGQTDLSSGSLLSALVPQAGRSYTACLHALLGRIWITLRSLQDTRKLPIGTTDW